MHSHDSQTSVNLGFALEALIYVIDSVVRNVLRKLQLWLPKRFLLNFVVLPVPLHFREWIIKRLNSYVFQQPNSTL